MLQSYSAYTAHLDDLNADALERGDGPERVLRPNDGAPVDKHWQGFESPAYFRALVCNYDVLSTGRNWQVLGRTGNRCGLSRALGEAIRVEDGRPIPVPTVDGLVSARLECEPGWRDRIEALLWRPRHIPRVVLDDRPARRLVVATAVNGLVLRAPNDGTLPGDPADYTIRTIAFRNLPGRCTVGFQAQPMTAAP